MAADDYPETYVRFMLECKDAYEDVCARIDRGEVPAGTKATIKIDIPVDVVDRIRFDRLAAAASVD